MHFLRQTTSQRIEGFPFRRFEAVHSAAKVGQTVSHIINQALEIIEKRGGDFEISSFTATPNDQMSEFNFRRTSSVQLKVYGVDDNMLDDITERLNSLVQVLESAEGVLTVMPADAA